MPHLHPTTSVIINAAPRKNFIQFALVSFDKSGRVHLINKMRMRLSVLLFAFIYVTEARRPKNILQGGGKMWALLAATSNGWDNYRHQADVCHAYQLLRRNGIPDENIIVMMADDIAYHPKNPTPGVIINFPGGPNVYENVPKDYTGKDVNPSILLDVLKGNKTALNGKGSGRVIESGPNDHIFVNLVDHGSPGSLYFPNGRLLANELIAVLETMAKESKFAKMAMLVEACESGSLFDNLLNDDLNIIVITAADPFESSNACYYDKERGTYLGDLFSNSWLNDAEHESLPAIGLHHMFERVRTSIKASSHAEEYGDLDIGTTKVSEFIGFRTTQGNGLQRRPSVDLQDVADSRNVPLISLEKKIENEKDPSKLKELKVKRNVMLKKRDTVDQVFQKIIQKLHLRADQLGKIYNEKYDLNKRNFPCYQELLDLFSSKCFNLSENPYAVKHTYTFINICNLGWFTVREAHNSIKSVCEGEPSFKSFYAV